MSIGDTVAVIDAASKLIGVLAWPAVTLFVLIRYGNSFKEFFATLNEFTLKGAGFEASFETKKAKDEASEALVAAAVAHQEEAEATPTIIAKNVRAASTAVEAVTSRTIRRVREASVLWVDDNPNNNINERRALEALGIKFVISTSTEDALAKMRQQRFQLVISDMGRPPDSPAGYALLDKIRQSGDTTPYIIYAGSRAPEHVAEAQRHGALGCTNRPDELFQYVLSALGS